MIYIDDVKFIKSDEVNLNAIHLPQKQYIQQLLKQYEMKNCYSALTSMIFDLKITDDLIEDEQFVQKYQELVGSQQFLIIYTRLDIVFAIGFLECYNNTPMQQC